MTTPDVILGQYLLPYQRAWLGDKSRRRVWLKARQIGATWVGIALDALLESLEWPHHVFIFSNRFDNAKRIISDIAQWLEIFIAAGVVLEADVQATQIKIGGSTIEALPATPSAARSIRGSVYVDEAATISQDAAFWQAIKPVLDSSDRYRVSLVSTPLGARGFFHSVWSDGAATWSRHRVTIYEAIESGLRRRIEDLRADARNFDQEYMCSFDAGGTYFQIDDLLALDQPTALDPPDAIVLGVDLGKVHDPSAIVAMSGMHVMGTWLMRHTHYADQRAILDRLATRLGASLICVDATAHPAFCDELARASSHRIRPVHMTNQWKARAVPALRDAIEARQIAIDFDAAHQWAEGQWQPLGARPLLDDLLKIEQTYTPSGLVKFDASRDSQGHADCASALFLAYDGATHPPSRTVFETGHPQKKRTPRESQVTF